MAFSKHYKNQYVERHRQLGFKVVEQEVVLEDAS